jgi:hypothetical protein
MVDARPIVSPMLGEAAEIGQAVVDQLKPMLDDAFARIDALPGVAAERENDALSALAHIGSFVALQLTARLMQRKRVDPETAMAVAMANISDRSVAEFVGVLFRGGASG